MSGVHYTTQMQIPNSRRWRARMGITTACLVVSLLTGCGQQETAAADTLVTLTVTEEGFLEFSGGSEEDAEEIERINRAIDELAEEYRDTLDDEERSWTVTSTTASGERILQGTIYITKNESSLLSGDSLTHQLASFAFDTETHTGYTAQDVLEADPLSSVELSTNVKQAFNVLVPGADLLTTEMQGFLLNDDASTGFFYMRVESDPDTEDPDNAAEEHFYIYDATVDAMTELDWPET